MYRILQNISAGVLGYIICNVCELFAEVRLMPEIQGINFSSFTSPSHYCANTAFSNMFHNASMSASSSSDLTLLLQKPRKWTHKHLEAARVKICENVTMEELLGQGYIPLDGDPGMGHP